MSGNTPDAPVNSDVSPALLPLALQQAVNVSTTSNLTVQHNGSAVASEGKIDFEDAGANVWTVADDPSNTRTKITPPKIVTGIIPATGTTATAGTGFTYTHTNGSGIYVFTFSPAFSSAPVVMISSVNNGVADGVELGAVTANGFTARLYTTTTGTASDFLFHFLAHQVG